ncbi:ribosomal protein S18-alanine N-acetyltransferase [Rhodococcus sp. BP-316]|jgi:ribosomal-protein-alanine N-acetyltransferase|uniref:ribosomal protein S18-alanine N-acetyltransferase n=1 Tax=unclassified Rhodococcus (in: high G+C Gram-positive bacteria) TaxID=192944 RepID=UPI000487FE78|nr:MULTISPECIES: ribosomal protein S18-alanine N-acetyltransferase [unclassified Rhodococcus (in: high G+C Gram-positive bacteria)]MBY6677937.1 ribosomal protein S18-alanine N-acetyltransferase [Rhodococcus sp. BP-332]MBY6680657.1 ribosomal protein S18-alanine N-acetyltransferase [Rhodococcus sp. BP-316]MBY6706547.1 ribosomal protein S18-alanine N-acetyltransferase [Rhodococcus sp. BP-241]MDQ1202237.1 ribosomal-protein-alanine N-acetyltransferase [Rhodococcus sp. SORGH_AS_0303]
MIGTVEPMRVEDADRCAELEAVLFPTDGPWPASAFVEELRGPHVRYFVVREDDGRAVGYAGIALLGKGEDTESEVHTIGVDPAAQRRGIGRALLDALLHEADLHGGPVFLEVRTDNEPAIELYRRAGFDIVGTRRRYYQPSGADAYTMTRPAPTTRGGHP